MIKNFIYKFLYLIDTLFIVVQYILIRLTLRNKSNYTLFFGGWGQLVQSIFFTHLLNKKDYKLILILDYKKFNLIIQDFSPKHNVMKIYSLLKLFNKDFSQYPYKFQRDIKRFSNYLFRDKFINLEKILYNKDQTFFNEQILSNYFKKILQGNEELSYSLDSFNASNYNVKKKFFYPKKDIEAVIEKKLKIKIDKIKKKSVNVTFRLRNKNSQNSDRTNYLRDSNYKNLKIITQYLLENTDYIIFITGDCDQLDIDHKNLIYYKKVQNQISRNLYTLAIQSLSNYHILQASGANELIKFNKSMCLYIDCWPPMNFFSNSIVLFKNIYQANKKISCTSYLKNYVNSLSLGKISNPSTKSKKNFIKFFKAKNFIIKDNSKKQILISLNEFLNFISNKKILRKNNNLNSFYKKRLKENNCILSEANFK